MSSPSHQSGQDTQRSRWALVLLPLLLLIGLIWWFTRARGEAAGAAVTEPPADAQATMPVDSTAAAPAAAPAPEGRSATAGKPAAAASHTSKADSAGKPATAPTMPDPSAQGAMGGAGPAGKAKEGPTGADVTPDTVGVMGGEGPSGKNQGVKPITKKP